MNRPDDQQPLTAFERASIGLVLLGIVCALVAISSLVSGCVNANTGSSTVVGEQMILPEITDSSDNIGVRVFEDIKGARVWTAKDSRVTIKYTNAWTNNVFSLYESRGQMGLDVEIEPLAVEGGSETNDLGGAATP